MLKLTPKPSVLWTFALVATAAVAGGGYLAGFVSRDQEIFPAAQLLTFKDRIKATLGRGGPSARAQGRIVWSTFLPLELSEHDVPPADRTGSGGGLTSVGDDLVLLTHDGRLFAASPDARPRPLGIAVPESGYADYEAAAQGKFGHLHHYLEMFRYNDVLHYEHDGARGLAVSYTEWHADRECYNTAVATLALPAGLSSLDAFTASPSDWRVIFRTHPCLELKSSYRALEGHAAGGRIAFLPPGSIVLGSGDYHWDGMYAPAALAQHDSNDYGKVVEIDLASGVSRHLSKGNRNVQGIAVDRNRDIWSVEHGPRGGDELNRIVSGRNYGWPLAVLGTRYNKLPVPSALDYGRHEGFEQPVWAWLPSVGISNVTPIEGFDSSWDGDLLVGSLTGESLFRVRIDDDRAVFAERIPLGHRIRYVHQHADDLIALWTDTGKLVYVRKTHVSPSHAALEEIVSNLTLPSARESRLRTNLETCMQCHSLTVGDDDSGPNLADAFDRTVASTTYAGYSESLRSLDSRWGHRELAAFLHDPSAFAPGTTMPPPNLTREDIDDLILVLQKLGDAE
jgi:cytochrome c2